MANPDTIPAQASNYVRRKIMTEQIRKLRKSPDISQMYSIHVPALRATFYPPTLKRYKAKIQELIKIHPDYDLICKCPKHK